MPNRIKEVNDTYDRLTARDYPLDYMKVPYNILQIEKKLNDIKTRIKILGNFNLPLYKSNHFKSCKVSWIITANDFLNGECRKKRYYCSPTYVDSSNKKQIILPAGNYLTYIFQGAFQPQATKIYDIITQYLHKQNLKIISPIKITTLKDFWTANTRDDYISMLSVAVEKK